MKNLMRLLFLGLISTPAFSADRVSSETLVCTRDYNPWGQASQCSCPSESLYEERIGRCLQDELEPVVSTGEITTEAFALGGETTGIELQTGHESYELVLPIALKQELIEASIKGVQYQVVGDLLEVEGVETGKRPTIIVNSLTVADE